jgi:hypothetical protein
MLDFLAAFENQCSKSRRKPMPHGTLLQCKSDHSLAAFRTILKSLLVKEGMRFCK